MDIKELKQKLAKVKNIDAYWITLYDWCKENNVKNATYASCFEKAKEIAKTGKWEVPCDAEFEDWMEDDPEEYAKIQTIQQLAFWGISEGATVSTMTFAEAIAEDGNEDEYLTLFDALMNTYDIVSEDDEYGLLRSNINLSNNLSSFDGNADDDYYVMGEETWIRLKKMGYSDGSDVITDDFITAFEDARIATCFYEEEQEDVEEYLENTYNVNFISPEDEVSQTELLWNKLVELGYSEGDIVNSDDVSEASDELGMDFDEAIDLVDELEEAYNVSVMSNDMLAGDGPGSYYETDSSANARME